MFTYLHHDDTIQCFVVCSIFMIVHLIHFHFPFVVVVVFTLHSFKCFISILSTCFNRIFDTLRFYHESHNACVFAMKTCFQCSILFFWFAETILRCLVVELQHWNTINTLVVLVFITHSNRICCC
jgi:hypothetical protein